MKITKFEFQISRLRDYDNEIKELKEQREEWKKDIIEEHSKYKKGQKFKEKNKDQMYEMIRADLYYIVTDPKIVYTCIYLNKNGTRNLREMNYFTVFDSMIEKGDVILID